MNILLLTPDETTLDNKYSDIIHNILTRKPPYKNCNSKMIHILHVILEHMNPKYFHEELWSYILPLLKDTSAQENIIRCLNRILEAGQLAVIPLIASDYYDYIFDKDVYTKYHDLINKLLYSILNQSYSQDIL